MTQTDPHQSPPAPSAPSISPQELAALIEEGSPVQAMDVRAPERVAVGHLHLIPGEQYKNIRGSELINIHDAGDMGLAPDLPTVVICGHGKDSNLLAAHLIKLGLDARSLSGGMAAWMNLTLPRVLDSPEGLDRLVQFDRIGKGCLGYLLVSGEEAIIVDPPFQFDSFLEVLEESEAKLVGVADTHVHADYVSGAPVLAQKLGVPYYLHPADAVFPYDGTPGKIEYEAVADGDTIDFGTTTLRVMHNPGHTEGSVTYLVEGRIALTGDFLFVESIGRPDLGGKEDEWTDQLWSSVTRAIREWGDGLAIYPAHYASESERRIGRAVGIPFGTLLQENEILKIQDPEVFLWTMKSNKAPFPEAYKKIKAMNLGLAPLVDSEIEEVEVGRNECALGGQQG
jgi:glyoxylase-like metal-dependent hydrolase (beta-lactamase superfamily II)